MKTVGTLLCGVLLGAFVHSASAAEEGTTDSGGHAYLGLGLSSLALDSSRVVDVATSSPGHSSKMISGILGYQINPQWAVDLSLGTDFSSEAGTDQIIANAYRFFGSSKWRPYVSAGFSDFSVNDATDDSTQQIQGGVGISGDLSHNMEMRLGYQVFFDLGDESNTDKAIGLSFNWHFRKPKAAAMAQAEPESVPVQKEVVDTYELLVEFDFDKSDIRSVFNPQFEEISDVLLNGPDITMTIEGHTDWVGTDEYNQSLSESRANAVKDIFVQDYGIAANRIEAIGFGESRPIGDNNTADGRQRNRRAISVILRPRMVTE